MTTKVRRHIIHKSRALKPTIWIGKNGVSQELLDELEEQLDKRHEVKIRILRSAIQGKDVREIASRVAEQTEALLVEVRGHTFILHKHAK